MVWVLDNNPTGPSDFRVQPALERLSIPFETIYGSNLVEIIQGDRVIISGSPLYDKEYPLLKNVIFPFLRDRGARVLGVCGGALEIASHYGANLYMGQRRECIPRQAVMTPCGDLLPSWGMPVQREVMVSNGEFCPECSPRLVCEARGGPRNEVMAFSVKDVPTVFGVVFHPEHPETQGGGELLRKFCL